MRAGSMYVSLFAFVGFAVFSVCAAELKVAVADKTALFAGSAYAAEIEQKAQEKQRELEEHAARLNEQLMKESQELASRFKGKGLTDSIALAKAQNAFAAKKKVEEAQFEKLRMDANMEIEALGVEYKKKIKDLVAEYAQEKGYAAIFDSNSEGVMFAGKDLDVTEDIAKFIAEKHRDEKRRSSLLASVTDGKNSETVIAASDNEGASASGKSRKLGTAKA